MEPNAYSGQTNSGAGSVPPAPPMPTAPPIIGSSLYGSSQSQAQAPGAVAPAAPAAPALAPPPAMTAAEASWLPPSVPLQSANPLQAGGAQSPPDRGVMVGTPSVADDGDLIEKEWVQKAKQIVQQTSQDPYRQTREIHKFRAEYMKKRYNKTIEPVKE